MPEGRLISAAAGRVVAVVGRAASLLESGNGIAIDACDLVIRVNWMLPVVGPPEHVGGRTDLVYAAVGAVDVHAAARGQGVPVELVNRRLRKRLRSGSFRPTTGVVAVYDALGSGAAEVRAFGFDFYRSGYAERGGKAQGRRLSTGRLPWRHDPALDQALMACITDPRFRPDRVLVGALV